MGNPPDIKQTLESENISEGMSNNVDSSEIATLNWMDAKTAADPLSIKYIEITKLLKMAKVMEDRLKDNPQTAQFDGDYVSIKRIEETYLLAYQIAKERCVDKD